MVAPAGQTISNRIPSLYHGCQWALHGVLCEVRRWSERWQCALPLAVSLSWKKVSEPRHSFYDSWVALSIRIESNAVATGLPSREGSSLTQQPPFPLGLSGKCWAWNTRSNLICILPFYFSSSHQTSCFWTHWVVYSFKSLFSSFSTYENAVLFLNHASNSPIWWIISIVGLHSLGNGLYELTKNSAHPDTPVSHTA